MRLHTYLPGDDGDLGHGGLSKGVEKLGSVSDDAPIFLGSARQEPGHVHKGDDGDVESITEAYKASPFN